MLLAVLAAGATALAFLPALGNGFVDLDDQENLVVNPWIRGLGPAHLRWMATAFHLGHWTPITWLSFAIDFRLWGLDPWGFHLTSLALHAANSALLCLLAIRVLVAAGLRGPRARAGAVVAALLWGLHPLRVESVAWATERRDVLSGFFLLLALVAYVPAGGRAPRFWGTVGCMVLALGSKASAMVLPALLFILDVYPLRRLGGTTGWTTAGARRPWIEKLALATLALPAALLAVAAQQAAGALQPLTAVTLAHRLGAALHGVGFYLWKTAWPVALLPLYEFPPDLTPTHPLALAGAATALAVGGIAVTLRRRCPGFAAASVWYLVAISPTLGFAQSGPQVAADRYTYLAMMGWSVLAGGLIANTGRLRALAGVAILLPVLGTLTWRQAATWRDAPTLWRRVVSLVPDHAFAHKSLGDAARLAGDVDGAIAAYREAIHLRPAYDEAYNNLASILAAGGRYDEAFAHYQAALRINPRHAFAHTSYGVALGDAGRLEEAIAQHQAALAIDPRLVEAHVNLGSALDDLGRLDEAMDAYETALRLKPTVEAYNNVGALLVKRGRPADAIDMFRRAVALRPDIAAVRENLGLALLAIGDRTRAAAELTAALRLDPSLTRARSELAALGDASP